MINYLIKAREWLHQGKVDHSSSSECAACHPQHEQDLIKLLHQVSQATLDQIEEKLTDQIAHLQKSFSFNDEYMKGYCDAYDQVSSFSKQEPQEKKIYILNWSQECEVSGNFFYQIGVFSTKEKAENAAKAHQLRVSDITSWASITSTHITWETIKHGTKYVMWIEEETIQ